MTSIYRMRGRGVGWEAAVLVLLVGVGVQAKLQGTEELVEQVVEVEKKEEKQNKEGDGRQCNHRHPREDEVSKSWWMSEPVDVMDQCKASRQLN